MYFADVYSGDRFMPISVPKIEAVRKNGYELAHIYGTRGGMALREWPIFGMFVSDLRAKEPLLVVETYTFNPYTPIDRYKMEKIELDGYEFLTMFGATEDQQTRPLQKVLAFFRKIQPDEVRFKDMPRVRQKEVIEILKGSPVEKAEAAPKRRGRPKKVEAK